MAWQRLVILPVLALATCRASSTSSNDNNQDEGPLPPGRACETNEQCQSGWCVDLPAGKACAALCAGECGSGLTCKRANGRDPSSASICVPVSSRLCLPCESDTDCGPFGDLCLPRDGASYCALDCSETQLCPEGYDCDSVRGDDGQELSRQCVPEVGSCTCSGANAGLKRPCRKTVPGVGTCVGEEVCDANAGWVSCDARTPMLELCDQQDNDCDGRFDEGVDGGPLQRDCGYGPEPRPHECTGKETCDNGVYGACSMSPPPAQELVCDGLDDNCDGQIDEGLLHNADNCASCGDVCLPGPEHDTSTVRACTSSSGSYYCAAIKCRVPFFDVNGSEADGCEIQDDSTRVGDTVKLNSTFQQAFVIGSGGVSCWDGDYQVSCGLKIPSDSRQHVPTSPPSPNVDFYRYEATGGLGCSMDQRICAKFVGVTPADANARIEVCASEPVSDLTTAPTFSTTGRCVIVDMTPGVVVMPDVALNNDRNSYYYVRVKSPVSGGGPFGGTYAVAAFDNVGYCPFTLDDPCIW